MTDKQNNEVEAWCVKDPSGYLWSRFANKSRNAVINNLCKFAKKELEQLEAGGFKVVKVKITEVVE